MDRVFVDPLPPRAPVLAAFRAQMHWAIGFIAATATWTLVAMLLLVAAVALTAALAPFALKAFPGLSNAAGSGRPLLVDLVLLCAAALVGGLLVLGTIRWIRPGQFRNGLIGAAVLVVLFAWSAFVDDAAPRMPLHFVLWLGCIPVYAIFIARARHAVARKRGG